MSEYFDCKIFKKTQSGKTFAIKIGSAKKRDDGGFNVYLDALPTGDGGFAIVPQQQREARPEAAARTHDYHAPLDDSIPF